MSKTEYTEAHKRADKKYKASTDVLQIRVPKGKKDRIKEHAASMNETIGQFVNRAIDETAKRDLETSTKGEDIYE